VKLLFMPYPSASGTWGCTVYQLAMAHEARRRGHSVLFHACPPSSRLLVDNGFAVRDFEGTESAPTSNAVRDIYDVFTSLHLNDQWGWQALMEAELHVIEEFRPDVVLADMRPTATLSAKRCGVPIIGMASVGTDPRLQARAAAHPLDELAAELARQYFEQPVASFTQLLFWTADRKLATSFASFEPELADVPGLSYIGYLNGTNRRGLDHLPPRPDRLVVAYLSTVGWSSPTLLRSLARTAELAGVTIWCVTNARGRVEQLDERLVVFDYLPLDELLPHCLGLLFHGGQGTALASLFHGIPSIAVPGEHYERRYNADRIAALGCGVHAGVLDLRPRVLSRLLQQIVDDPAYAAAAVAAGVELRALPGAVGAVDVIEDLSR